MNIQYEAKIRVAAMLFETSKRGIGRVNVMRLTDYTDAETFQFWLPRADWTFAEWRAVNQECARQLRQWGFQVKLVHLDMAAYLDWLAGKKLSNSPENRATFAASRSL